MKIQTARKLVFPFLFITFYFFLTIISYGYSVYDYPFIYPDRIRILERKNVSKYIIQNSENSFCNEKTKMLIMVFTHVNDLGERMLVRRTWAKEKSNTTELKFIVGYKLPYSDILKENKIFKDIIMTNILEEYYNLSLKTLAMLLFHQNNCHTTKCLIKVDSDNVIDIPQFEKLCQKHSEKEAIHGYCLTNMKVLRRKTFANKWDIPHYVYDNDIYPTYCRGGHYLITGKKTTKKLLKGLQNFGFFESLNKQKMPEDVLFNGIAAEIAKIPRINNSEIIPCIKNGVECLYNNPIPENWISATIGNENMDFYQSCTLSFNWKDCVNLL